MKIRTFNDFKNLKKGTWFDDATGIYEVIHEYRERNSTIDVAEVFIGYDESGACAFDTRTITNVTFNDIKGAEII